MARTGFSLEVNRQRNALKFWAGDKEVFDKVCDYIKMVIDADRYSNWLMSVHIDQDGWKHIFEEDE